MLLDAIGLHLRDCAVLDAIELPRKINSGSRGSTRPASARQARIRRGGVELRQRLDQVERQRLVHREVVLKVHVDAQLGALVCPRDELNDAARDERSKDATRARSAVLRRPFRDCPGAAAIARQPSPLRLNTLSSIPWTPGTRDELLWRRTDQPLERVQVPVDEVVLGGLAFDDLLAVAGGLLAQPEILDDVLRRLDDDETDVVEALAPGAAGDLVEVADAEVRCLLAVELAQPREEDRADGHVDAGAERVRSADHLQQSRLCQLLDQHAYFGSSPAWCRPMPCLSHLRSRRRGC